VICSTFTCIPLAQEVNLFFVDARREGPLLCKKKKESYGDCVAKLVHSCSKSLAVSHPGKTKPFLLKFSYLSKELCPQNLLCSSHFLLVHAAGGVLCVLCHPFEASYAHAAMQEDTLTCFHHVYHASIREKPASSNFQEVTCTPS